MKRKMAIVKGGFSYLHNNFLKNFCLENNISVDILEKPEDAISNFDEYDFVLSDCFPIKNCCRVFHQHTMLYQLSKSNNFLYSFIYYIFHLDKIRKQSAEIKSYKKLIAVSNEIKRDLEKFHNIPSDKIIVANAGFVIPELTNDNKIFKKYDNNSPFIICASAVGFITKGGYTLLGALKEFRKLYPSIKIKANIIYPKYKTNLAVKLFIKIFNLSDVVEFFDYQKDINAFYNKAHCLICPSVYEAFGRIVPEAMYQKIPVIVGSNIGASDIVQDNINGFIFKDDKKRSVNLAKKIKEVYDKYNDLEILVEKAYKTSKNSTWENFAESVFYGLYPEFQKTVSEIIPKE